MRSLYRRSINRARAFLQLFVLLLALFAMLEFVLGSGFGLMQAARCFPAIGCNAGPGGFDAIVHVVSGLAEGVLFAILVRVSTRHRSARRILGLLVLYAVALAVAWELFEYGVDRLGLAGAFGGTNVLLQHGADDTVADMILSGGAAVLAGLLGIRHRREARES